MLLVNKGTGGLHMDTAWILSTSTLSIIAIYGFSALLRTKFEKQLQLIRCPLETHQRIRIADNIF